MSRSVQIHSVGVRQKPTRVGARVRLKAAASGQARDHAIGEATARWHGELPAQPPEAVHVALGNAPEVPARHQPDKGQGERERRISLGQAHDERYLFVVCPVPVELALPQPRQHQ